MNGTEPTIGARARLVTDALGAAWFAVLLLSAAALAESVDAESDSLNDASRDIADQDRTVTSHGSRPTWDA